MNTTKFLTVISCSFMFSSGLAQCIADLEPDMTVCVNLNGAVPEQLGANLTVEGGVPPYSYAWETYYEWSVGEFTSNFYASDFLNDTTLAQPTITNPNDEELVFTLTVTDSLGMSCVDSVRVEFCHFSINLGTMYYEINPGDSVQLNETNMYSSCQPNEFVWQPTHGLTDSTGMGVWASPDSSTAYYTIVSDSAGCVETSAPFYYITVLTTGLDDNLKKDISIQCYPNPIHGNSVIDVQKAPPGMLRFEILDTKGSCIWERVSRYHRQVIDRNDLPAAGNYFYRVWQDDAVLGSGKLIAE